MWVDKYRPTKFTDLLGEEVSLNKPFQTSHLFAKLGLLSRLSIQRCHRDVLSWLKDWDKCVFKSVAPGVQAKKRNRMEGNEEFAYVGQMAQESID